MKIIKNIVTNYIFVWMFEKHNFKEGDLLTNGNENFICTFNNGNPGSLKWFFKIDGFWNYIETQDGKWIYKNCIYKVGETIHVSEINEDGNIIKEYTEIV